MASNLNKRDIDRETAFPLDRIWRLVCMLICLIRLLVYRRSEFHNHTVLSCTCASPSSFVIDFALSRERIERERQEVEDIFPITTIGVLNSL